MEFIHNCTTQEQLALLLNEDKNAESLRTYTKHFSPLKFAHTGFARKISQVDETHAIELLSHSGLKSVC